MRTVKVIVRFIHICQWKFCLEEGKAADYRRFAPPAISGNPARQMAS
ncbi:MAG: hypothetical protein H8E87_01465 [FCB group bacterium]|nr:hypothetical protein [FCB group bacterium]